MAILSPHVLARRWFRHNCCSRCSPARVGAKAFWGSQGRTNAPRQHPAASRQRPGNFSTASRQHRCSCLGKSPAICAPTNVFFDHWNLMVFQQFCRDLAWQVHASLEIVRVHTFGGIIFLFWSKEITTFSMFRWIRAPILSQCMFLV